MKWQRLVFPVFFVSGALALIYQIAWVRALTLEFGSTSLAVATVVAVFLAGLGIGARLVGARADSWRRPLAAYALLELGVAFWGLTSLLFIHYLLPLFSSAAAGLGGEFWTVSLVRLLAACLMLLPPTILMGASLPVLARFYVRMKGEGGRGSGLLYGVNTLGAFIGVLLGGLYFLPVHGLSNTVVIASALNAMLGLVAGLGARRMETPLLASTDAASDSNSPTQRAVDDRMARIRMPAAITLTAAAALICQVAWVRVMELLLGASVFAVTIVLGLFLAGLGLGAFAVAAFLRHGRTSARKVFSALALLSALAILLSSWSFQFLPELYVQLHSAWQITASPGRIIQLQFLIAAIVVLLPTLLLGGLFPAALRAVIEQDAHTSRHTGRLFAWDTAGSIAGSLAAGFPLIPLLGIDNSLRVAVVLLLAGAVLVSEPAPGRLRHRATALSAVVLLLAAGLLMPQWDRALMTSAVYQYGEEGIRHGDTDLRTFLGEHSEILYYRDGLTATVTVMAQPGVEEGWRAIALNGKIEGSNEGDMPSQRLIAHIPLLLRPDAKQVAVIGMGTGSTAAAAAAHPVDRVDVVEIEAAMVEGARYFRDYTGDLHNREAVNIHVTDGRLFLNMRPGHYDVIISQPSNPWLAGASDLFTREAFERGGKALRDGGVFAQWVQIYNLSPGNLRMLLRGFADVFPHVYLFQTIENTDLLLLGAFQPLTMDLAAMQETMRQESVAADLAQHHTRTEDVFDIAGRLLLGPGEIAAFTGPGAFHSDDRPLIAYRAPFDLFRSTRQANNRLISDYAGNAAAYLSGWPAEAEERQASFERLVQACRARVGLYAICEGLRAP